MVVSGLSIWIVLAIALVITGIYWLRHKKTWMGNLIVVAIVFAAHFFWFGTGVILFLIGELIRAKMKKNAKENIEK